MRNQKVVNSLIQKISTLGYERCVELFNTWDEYVKDCSESDSFERKDYYEEDGTPSVSKIAESVEDEYRFTKEHMYPEDVIGEDCSEEEQDSYEYMDDLEISNYVDLGIKKFVNEHTR